VCGNGAVAVPMLSCRGLEVVRKCSCVFLEAYTSILMCDKHKLVRVGVLLDEPCCEVWDLTAGPHS
jgi:diphthamide biosynthesis methyltransferase